MQGALPRAQIECCKWPQSAHSPLKGLWAHNPEAPGQRLKTGGRHVLTERQDIPPTSILMGQQHHQLEVPGHSPVTQSAQGKGALPKQNATTIPTCTLCTVPVWAMPKQVCCSILSRATEPFSRATDFFRLSGVHAGVGILLSSSLTPFL